MAEARDHSVAQRMTMFLLLKREPGRQAMAEEDAVYPALRDTAGAPDKARE